MNYSEKINQMELLSSFSRVPLKITQKANMVEVFSPDSLARVFIKVTEQVQHIGLFNLRTNSEDNLSYLTERLKALIENLAKDPLLMETLEVFFQIDLCNTSNEGNICFLILEGLKTLIKTGTYKEYNLKDLFDEGRIPLFFFYVLIGNTFYLNPLKTLSKLKEGTLAASYLDQLWTLELNVKDTQKTKIGIQEVLKILESIPV